MKERLTGTIHRRPIGRLGRPSFLTSAGLQAGTTTFRKPKIGRAICRPIKRADGRLDHPIRLDEIGTHSNMEWVDYLFCPAGDVERIGSALPVRDAGNL